MILALCRKRDYRSDLIATVARRVRHWTEMDEHSDTPLNAKCTK
jgi:hypothetical protein